MNSRLKTQKGAATLFVAIMLLISVSLVAFFTARVVLNQTKNMADDYRTVQAISAANYAMDYAVNYFDRGGFDLDGDGVLDHVDPIIDADSNGSPDFDFDGDGVKDNSAFPPPDLAFGASGAVLTSTVTFNNTVGTRCVPAGNVADMKHGMISVTGQSDDGTATRRITQCVAPLNLLSDDGPDMPLISRADVAMTGSAHIVNRYSNINIWSGHEVTIGSSSAMETYIKDPNAGVLSQAELLDTDPTHNTQLVSNRNLGNGADIIDSDPALSMLSPDSYFTNIFDIGSRDAVKELAENIDQSYTDIDDAIGKSGVIWVDGDQSLNSNGIIGSTNAPAILIVNGDFNMGGGPTIYGLVYVVGQFTVSGTASVVGSCVVEGNGVASNVITGTGTLNLVYWKGFLDDSSGTIPGLSALIPGSWRDF